MKSFPLAFLLSIFNGFGEIESSAAENKLQAI